MRYYTGISNSFPGGLFEHVRTVSLFDERPFEHEFFLRIQKSFPFMEELFLDNDTAQNRKQSYQSNSDTQNLSLIEYTSLYKLSINTVHDDYTEEFLLDAKTYFQNNLILFVSYESLQRVTYNFSRDATRTNCGKITLAINQPKFSPAATWNSNGITVVNRSIAGQFPRAIFVNTNNTIYAADKNNNTIVIWQEESIDSTKVIFGNFTEPRSLFITLSGDIYIDDGAYNGRVQKWIVETKNFVTVMNIKSACYGLFVDINDILYCSIAEHHQVVKRSLNDSNMTPNRVAAGTGISGVESNELSSAMGIFVDVNLDLYVADCGNNRVQLFPSGESNGITVAGSGSLRQTIELNYPAGIILDAEKYLFIVDRKNHRIVGSDLSGFRCLVGCYGKGSQSNQLNFPSGLSFDRSGNMFVADLYNGRIQKFLLMNDTFALSFNQPKFCPTATWNPTGITFDNQSIVGQYLRAIFVNTNNTIYVIGKENNTIVMWQEESVNPTKIISGNFTESQSLFVTLSGDIYIDDGINNRGVQRWSAETNMFVIVMNVNSTCYGLFVDINDTLYCSMAFHHQVVKRSLNDPLIVSNNVAAGTGIDGLASNQLDSPEGIFVDVNLDLYVADCGNHRVQLFQPGESNGTTVAGSTSLNPTITLECPSGIVLDDEKYLFIVDHRNHRIVGSGLNGFRCLVGCYGKGSQSNQLNYPSGLSFDRSGNMFVIDTSNRRIQKFKYLNRYCVNTSSVLQKTYSSSLTNNNQIYYRDCNKQNFYYESIQVNVIESGYYNFRGRGDIDPYGSIYKNKFNPFDPSENLLDQDYDRSSDIQFKFDIHLDVDMIYVLVVTTYDSKETGKFSILIFGKNKVILERLSTPVNIQLKYSLELTHDSPTYYRDCQVPQCHYETLQIYVNTTGLYVLWSDSNINAYGYIYKNDFNPLKPSENLLLSHGGPEESSCVIGDQCNFHIKGIGLTLDDILRDELQPSALLNNQSFSIKLSAGLTIIMFTSGLINSILSFITFQSKDSQQVGCGTYLLTSSITSLLTISMFIIKFWFVVLTHINVSTSLFVLRGGCASIEPILKLFLYLDGWLNACVAVERAVLIFKGVNFDKTKSKSIARRTILILPFFIFGTLIHEFVFRRLFEYELAPDTTDTNKTNRDTIKLYVSCITRYSPSVQDYNTAVLFIHLVGPFIVNLFSALFIIFGGARQRSVARTNQNFKEHAQQQFSEHKQLIISPTVLLVLSIPRLIISLLPGCVKTSENLWLYLGPYFISFTPSMLMFLIFVFPSKLYMKAFKQSFIRILRRTTP
ncbi:unnamed protein product [Adineta steineri]|uniref:Uncharacterized protein n=1 Tax=Adineta steineri TaxID=433720 RepID=A0A814MSG5_9BILA|nr:unnamed protein product [Adineta steineri]